MQKAEQLCVCHPACVHTALGSEAEKRFSLRDPFDGKEMRSPLTFKIRNTPLNLVFKCLIYIVVKYRVTPVRHTGLESIGGAPQG